MNPTVKIYLLDAEGRIRAPSVQQLLFTAELKELENFQQLFRNHGIPPSRSAALTIERQDSEWRMTDSHNDRAYIIRREKDRLNVYEGLQRWRVDIRPVREFIDEVKSGRKLERPIYGEDALSLHRQGTFSAAKISIIEEMYLYVMLGGEQRRFTFAAVKENFKQIKASFILKITTITLLVIFISIGVIGLVSFFILTRRLRTMTAAVQKFEKEDFQQRIPVKSDTEMDRLGKAFNQMADTIVANMAKIRENDRLRRELIANISHDLRTPLTSIQGYLETILMKDSGVSPAYRRYLETSLNNAVMLRRLVEALFELSQLDAKQTTLKPEPFSIAELAQDVVLKFQPQAEQQQIHLRALPPQNVPFVYGDIGMIDRVLSNLIDNAICYTSAGGEVIVEVVQTEDRVQTKVSDTGCGIPLEDLPRIFDRFYRVEKGRARTSGGAGLGLAIAQKIVEAHESQITVESVVDVGTTFAFELPIYRNA